MENQASVVESHGNVNSISWCGRFFDNLSLVTSTVLLMTDIFNTSAFVTSDTLDAK